MIIHLADSRGKADHGWLKSAHSFSFAEYYNPERMNFGALRVINDDIIAAGKGFGRHPHLDMEIITIPMEGSVRHEDSEGNYGIISRGEIQVMSAGTGIFHSEFSDDKQITKMLQIWILPELLGVKPRYDQKKFSLEERMNLFQLLLSHDGRENTLPINQNAFISISELMDGKVQSYELYRPSNGVYFFIMSGSIEVDGHVFQAKDGIGLTQLERVSIKSIGQSELLILEVPLLI
jgi:redox-sensitive bicupin YhaK (pirin superfamily)